MICSPVCGSRWTSRVGSSSSRRRIAVAAFSSSPFDFGLVGERHHRRGEVERREVDVGLLLREHVAGTRLLELRHRADVSGAELVHGVHLLPPGRGELADPLLGPARGIQDVRVRPQDARLHAQQVDPPGVGVGGRLEDVREHLARLVGGDVRVGVLRAEGVDRAAHRRRGQILEQGLEQPVGPEVLGGDAAGHREKVALGHALLERGDDLVVRDLLALEVALHQLVRVLGHLVHQLLAVLLGPLPQVLGNLGLLRVAAPLALVEERLHVDQVDHPAHIVLGADRDLGRDDVLAKRGLQGVERAKEVRAFAVEHVHEDEAREALVRGALPEPLGVDLDAGHGVHYDHG